MRKFLISAALVSAVAIAAPAAAQYQGQGRHNGWSQGNRNHDRQIVRDIEQLDNRIDRAFQRGVISRREAMGLNREVNQLRQLFHRFSRDGLDRGEAIHLQHRIDRLQQRLRFERRDRDGRRG